MSDDVKPEGKLREVGRTPRGYTIYVQTNEIGSNRYWSDSIGGGVVVWDTALASEEELLFAMKAERNAEAPPSDGAGEIAAAVIRAAREQARADCCGGNTRLNERGAFPVPCRVWTRIPALAPDAGRALRSTLTGQDKESAVAEHTARDESLTAEELAAIKERRSGTDIPRLVAAYNDAVAAADALNSDVTFFVSLLERTLGFMEGVARVCDVEGANTKEALMAEVHRARAALTVPQEKQQENT